MQIALVRTGGFIPLRKKAEAEVNWSEQELMQLIETIKLENAGPGKLRDATGYHLEINDQTVPIDLDKIPANYQSTFEDLKDNLQPVAT
jgi:hypothetical protein